MAARTHSHTRHIRRAAMPFTRTTLSAVPEISRSPKTIHEEPTARTTSLAMYTILTTPYASRAGEAQTDQDRSETDETRWGAAPARVTALSQQPDIEKGDHKHHLPPPQPTCCSPLPLPLPLFGAARLCVVHARAPLRPATRKGGVVHTAGVACALCFGAAAKRVSGSARQRSDLASQASRLAVMIVASQPTQQALPAPKGSRM